MSTRKLSIVLEALAKHENLNTLDFSFCSLDDSAGKVLKEFLKINTSLEHLELQGNKLSGQGCNELAIGLVNFKWNLKYLGINKIFIFFE